MATLELAKYRLVIRPRESLLLPEYKGSAFRGGFGHALRRVVCPFDDGRCYRGCIQPGRCVYSYVFETPLPEDIAAIFAPIRGALDAPHPFVLEPPEEEKQHYSAHDRLAFHLILIGRAMEYLPYFLFSFDELGRIGLGKGKGHFQLEGAFGVGPEGEVVVYKGIERRFAGVGAPITLEEVARKVQGKMDEVEIEFLTPARLKYGHKLTSRLEFHILFRALLLRVSLLVLCHGDSGMLPLPSGCTVSALAVAQYFYRDHRIDAAARRSIHEAIEGAKDIAIDRSDLYWRDWERYSARQDARMKLGGMVGSIKYRGALTNFLPYLLFGEYLHVGKNTSFGLGKMRLHLSAEQRGLGVCNNP
ncbi:MAG: CRISPR system precrRNA processing endoribonuclease RAMP protein Cas6 [Candidatus Entotheonellia bacterium]